MSSAHPDEQRWGALFSVLDPKAREDLLRLAMRSATASLYRGASCDPIREWDNIDLPPTIEVWLYLVRPPFPGDEWMLPVHLEGVFVSAWGKGGDFGGIERVLFGSCVDDAVSAAQLAVAWNEALSALIRDVKTYEESRVDTATCLQWIQNWRGAVMACLNEDAIADHEGGTDAGD